MQLSADERRRIDRRLAECEAATGAQVVTAVVGKCDNYPEIPWKAFALGAAGAALVLVLFDAARPSWTSAHAPLASAILILGAGAALALATITIHAFARLFIHAARAETEVLQYARVLFLHHELFATGRRNGVLILVSVFERQVAIIPDTGLWNVAPDAELHRIIGTMTPLLRRGEVGAALCKGVEEVGALLLAAGARGSGGDANTLPDAIIEVDGGDDRR